MPAETNEVIKMRGDKVVVHYGEKQALFDVDLDWSARTRSPR